MLDFDIFQIADRITTKLIIKTGNIHYYECVSGLQLSIEIKNIALRCFSNAPQRENPAPFSHGKTWVFIIIIFKLLVRLFWKIAWRNCFWLGIFWKHRRQNRSTENFWLNFENFSKIFIMLRFRLRYFQKMRNKKLLHASFENARTSSLEKIIIKTHIWPYENGAHFSRCWALLKQRIDIFYILIESLWTEAQTQYKNC